MEQNNQIFRPQILLTHLLVIFLLTACGGGNGTPDNCQEFQGVATSQELAQTPRVNAEAEILSLEASGKLVAPQNIYDRVINELLLIRALNSNLHDISVSSSWGNSLLIKLDAQGETAYQSGSYHAWDCPNEYYKLIGIEDLYLPVGWHALSFEGRLNIPILANEYTNIPNVESSELNGLTGDGNDVCLSIDGNLHYYIFDIGTGDCPAGCINHTYWGYSIDSSEVITELGVYVKGTTDPPTWFENSPNCTKWL